MLLLSVSISNALLRPSLQRSSGPLRVLSSADIVRSSSSKPSSLILDPLVVCGPSGVGKGTLINKFMNELGGSEAFGFTVSHTTRQPRPGEKNGIHYHFTTHHIMERHIENGRFLEHAKVHGHLYGTSWDALEDVQVNQKKKCLLDIDVQGVQTLKQLNLAADKWQPRYVFIAPPSLPVLLERLSSRGTESEESIRIRSSKAKEEVDYGTKEGVFDAIVVNDDLDESCREFAEVVRGLYYS